MKNTESGKNLELMVCALLSGAGFSVQRKFIGFVKSIDRQPHRIDIYAVKNKSDILVSCIYQNSVGSAQKKLPHEYMSLAKSMTDSRVQAGYIVLFGKETHTDTLKDFIGYMNFDFNIKIVSLEEFTEIINKGYENEQVNTGGLFKKNNKGNKARFDNNIPTL